MAGNVRRTWDKELYERKAQERKARGDAPSDEEDEGDDDKEDRKGVKGEATEAVREEFLPAEPGAAGPMGSQRAFVRARQGKLDLESNVGKTQIVTAAAIEAGVGAGYWCEVCSCTLKDSNAYLDHINGKKHQRALGFSMRVERVAPEAVKSKLEALKRKLAGGASSSTSASSTAAEVASTSAVVDEELRKRRKKEEKEARRKEIEAAELEDADPEIQELMGFGSFGGGGKKG